MTATTARAGDSPAVFVVKGSEPALVDRGVELLLAELTSPEATGAEAQDPTGARGNLAVAIEDHRASNSDEDVIGPVTDALYTPAFLADRRIVVLRDAENLDASQAAELASRISEPFAPNVLVLAIAAKALPAGLAKAVKSRSREIDTSPGSSGKARTQWLSEQLQTAPVHLDPAARHLLEGHLGEDVSRLHALFEILTAAYGEGARLTPIELEPFLGDEGGAPPWELTEALDNGEVAKAVKAARRLLGPGGRHPFQLLATLHKHYASMLRLDGSGITDPAEAASVLGMPPYPARKVFTQGSRLGIARIARAVSLGADADHDLRGVLAWPDELVIEVLVARLAQLSHTRMHSPAVARRPARTP